MSCGEAWGPSDEKRRVRKAVGPGLAFFWVRGLQLIVFARLESSVFPGPVPQTDF